MGKKAFVLRTNAHISESRCGAPGGIEPADKCGATAATIHLKLAEIP
jgi:hypothetical protein